MRHSKVDVISEVVLKGGRSQSNTSLRTGASSAIPPDGDRCNYSSSSFRSSKSGQFHEVELTQQSFEMEPKAGHDEKYEMVEDPKMSAAYDNEALRLDEDQPLDPKKLPKISTASSASAGLVMEGSRSSRTTQNSTGEDPSDIPFEAQKYALSESLPTAIKVKSALGDHTDDVVYKEECDDNHDADLKRSSTLDSGSVPSTSNTFESSRHLSNYCNDETLLIEDPNGLGSSTISHSVSKYSDPPKDFETPPPGLTVKSLETYRKVSQNGFKSGRCLLMSMVVITFFVTMFLAIIMLIAPKNFKEKEHADPSSSLSMSSTPLPTKESFPLYRNKEEPLELLLQRRKSGRGQELRPRKFKIAEQKAL